MTVTVSSVFHHCVLLVDRTLQHVPDVDDPVQSKIAGLLEPSLHTGFHGKFTQLAWYRHLWCRHMFKDSRTGCMPCKT